MIGFFDSGLGGLTILKDVRKILPDHSFIYLGDNARTPYGSHSQEIIYKYTCEGIEELFLRGASLVVLACNTASAVALKKIQQEYLPMHHPDKNVLGVIIPVTEGIQMFNSKNIGIFATEATVSSKSFEIEIEKTDPSIVVTQQACPLLVPLIEAGENDRLENFVEKYVKELFEKNKDINVVILGCTHYALIENLFRKHIPNGVRIISQGKIVAEKLKKYLKNHQEIDDNLRKDKSELFLTTENSPHIKHLACSFYGKDIDLEIMNLIH